MAAIFDRMEFVRALRGKTTLPDETVEALADALHKQQETADLVTKKDLDMALSRLEGSLKPWAVGCVAALAAYLSALKFFG